MSRSSLRWNKRIARVDTCSGTELVRYYSEATLPNDRSSKQLVIDSLKSSGGCLRLLAVAPFGLQERNVEIERAPLASAA